MIALTKYISNINNYVSNNILEDHFKLEFDINNSLLNSIFINEKHGNYDDQIELVNEISMLLFTDIKNNNNKDIVYIITKKDLEDAGFKNIFFKEIKLEYNDKISGYDSNVKYDDNEKLINQVIIVINSNENKTYNEIYTTLIHELTHAFEDYNRLIKNGKSLYKEINSKMYNELLKKMKLNNDIESICSSILYYCKSFEINAYISELTSELEKQNKKINSYKDALNIFYNSECYNIYATLQKAFEKYYNTEEFKNVYNKLTNSNLTINKIYKTLSNKFINIFNRISTLIPKVYYDYYVKQNMNESILTNNKSYIELLNILDKGYISKIKIG